MQFNTGVLFVYIQQSIFIEGVNDIYPIGRLDKDSEGLLLLTNDGALQHRLSHPKFEKEKTYWVQWVQVEGEPNEASLTQLRRGVEIQDYRTKPAKARRIHPEIAPRDPPIRFRKLIPANWLEITLTEGRNRQVRRMTAAVGLPTLRLIRVTLGPFRLGDLLEGEWRELNQDQILELFPAKIRHERVDRQTREGAGSV